MNKVLPLILLGVSMTLAVTTSFVQKASKPAEFEGYEYGTATVHYNGMYYRFYCSHGLNSEPFILQDNLLNGKPGAPDEETLNLSMDYIRMRTSRDGSVWSAPRVVLVPTKNHDKPCACDPAIVYDEKEKFWYLYYTSFVTGSQTVTNVARSKNIDGPYIERYVGEGKGNNGWTEYPEEPKAILKASSTGGSGYGLGQISVVKMNDGKYHFWFNSTTHAPWDPEDASSIWHFSHIKTDSPYKGLQEEYEKLRKKGQDKISFDGVSEFPRNDFGDVKWNPSIGKFEMWITSKHFYLDNGIYIKRYVSKNGNEWTFTDDQKGAFSFASNVGMSGNEKGWIENNNYLVTFGAPDEISKYSNFRLPDKRERQIKQVFLENQYGAVTGKPWSTFQFVVGGNKSNIVSLKKEKNKKYFQFPISNPQGKDLNFITGDFDGDGIADIGAVDCSSDYIAEGCFWYIRSSQTGKIGLPNIPNGWHWLGMNRSHTIVVGDFDGDGKADPAIVDAASKTWYVISSKSPNGENLLTLSRTIDNKNVSIFGWVFPSINKMTHVLTGDYDGDGISDIGAVDCSKSCIWKYISSRKQKSVNLVDPNNGKRNGKLSDYVVLEGDYDGDGKTDPTIWHPTEGWFTISSRTGKNLIDPLLDGGTKMKGWKWTGVEFIPVVGDFNGDGRSDRSIVKKATIDAKTNVAKPFEWFLSMTSVYSRSYLSDGLLDYFKYLDNYQILVGDIDGDAVSDCIIVDKTNARVYFYSSEFSDGNVQKTIYRMASSSLAKEGFVPGEPSIDEEQLQTGSKTLAKFRTNGLDLIVSEMNLNSEIGVFNMIGQSVFKSVAGSSEMKIQLPSKGRYVVRVGNQSSVISVK